MKSRRKMKSSGIPWLGDVPEGWEIDKIKHHLRISSDRNPGDATVLSLYREYGVIPKDSRDDNHNVTSEDTSKYRYVREGDFAINKMKAWQGSMAVSGYEGIVSPAYYVYRFDSSRLESKYFHHLIRTRGYASEFRRLSTGVREGQWDLHPIDFENTRILLPPLPEQRVIAERIDCEIARVDALREKIKCEIERLGYYKKSLIAEKVTRGLSKRKMKPSGIPWLGDVPAEWETRKIGSLYIPRNVKVSDSDFPPLSVTKQGVLPQLEHVAKSNDRDNRKLVKENDFVINSRSDRRGSCGIAKQDGSVSLINIVLQPLGDMEPQYFDWLFHTAAFADEFYKWGQGIDDDVWSTHWTSMKKIVVPFPPLPEQREIAEYLDRAVSKIDAVVARRKTQLEKLESFKRSLIQEYVTGKREVCL